MRWEAPIIYVTAAFFATAASMVLAAAAAAEERAALTFYGTPGLIDMPTATGLPDGELSFATSYSGKTVRNTLTFQISSRLSGSFRYSALQQYGASNGGGTLYDRSFDVQYRVIKEGVYRPDIAIGLRDFGGTGIFGAEYVVATKHITPGFVATGGIGWGRLGSYGSFRNPLSSVFGSTFDSRSGFSDTSGTGGQLAFGSFFHGDAALFGGVEWLYSDHLSFRAEYSSDAYVMETARMGIDHKSPFNFGLNYRFDNGFDLGTYYNYGSEFGVVLSYSINPKHPPYPGGRDGMPPPVYPRDTEAAASWGLDWASEPVKVADARAAIKTGIEQQGMGLEALSLSQTSVTLYLINGLYNATPQAIGRAARSLTGTLPPSVETIIIVPVNGGMPVSSVTLQRRDLEELEGALDGAWQSYVRAVISDAAGLAPAPGDILPNAFPAFSYQLKSYFQPALFDPDAPVRADFGAELNAAFTPLPGLIFSGTLRQPLIGNLDQATRMSNSVLPHVRSDVVLYDTESELEMSHLTAEYFFRPGRNLYGRVTAGYLEKMYGGISSEVLWKPVSGPLALGLEVNYARKRDFDQGFGFQDYDIVTGHASAYYDFGNGYLGQLDAGRYLAGDWGATFGLDREFANGVRVGAWFTLTNVSFEDFGEGAFDKGIRFSIPLSWISGEPSMRGFGTSVNPITRDGGARLRVRNRLYELTRGYHDPIMQDSWGTFWR